LITDDFSAFLAQQGRKPRTIKRHLENLSLLSKSLQSKESVVHFLLLEQQRGLRNTSINNYISTVKMWGHFKGKDDLLTIPYWKKQSFTKAILSDKEIEDLLALPRPEGRAYPIKLYAMYTMFFSIMAFSGMRPSEIASLRVQDVDWGQNVFHIQDGKTGGRDVPISPMLSEPLHTYLKELETPLLFPVQRGGHARNGKGVIDSGEWNRAFHGRCTRLGIVRDNLSVYSLRHSFITRMLGEDVNIFKVQKIVGHRKLETTAVYTHLTQKDSQRAIRKDPLGRKATDPKELITQVLEQIKSYGLDTDPRFVTRITESNNGLEVVIFIK